VRRAGPVAQSEEKAMMYLQNSFTVPAAPEKITACEACVYGRGLHEWWCPVGTRPLDVEKILQEPAKEGGKAF
jgi:hypothetical protein